MLVKIIVLTFGLSLVNLFAYDIESINKIFSDLEKQKFNKIEVSDLANPFQKVDLNSSNLIKTSNGEVQVLEEKIVLKLEVIFNNKAKINDKWYKVGEEVLGFKVVAVNFDTVVLKNGEKKEILSLMKKNNGEVTINEIK